MPPTFAFANADDSRTTNRGTSTTYPTKIDKTRRLEALNSESRSPTVMRKGSFVKQVQVQRPCTADSTF